MSGARDYKHLVTTHREEENERQLVRRFAGSKSKTYKAVNYDKLRTLAAEKKFEGHRALIRVKKLKQISKDSKEQNILKQHKKVWQKECIRLNNLRKRFSGDVEIFVLQNTEDETVCQSTFQEFEEYQSRLLDELQAFKSDTVDPVWTLREDLQYWLATNLASKNTGIKGEYQQIGEAVESVKQQQYTIVEKLDNEQISLEKELGIDTLLNLIAPVEKSVDQGIPEEAFDIECPDLELKASVLQEFILLDERHRQRLEDCEEKHSHVMRDDNGGWSDADNWSFNVLCEAYPFDLHNRRTLLFDRLKRHFPDHTRDQLLEHEQFCIDRRYYLERRKAIIHDWLRDRKELFLKAKAIFAEACIEAELDEAKNECKLQQSERCASLYNKVKLWREKKWEQLLLEQEVLAAEKQKHDEIMREAQDRDLKIRQQDKVKIKEYQSKQEEARCVKEEADRKRLEELKRHMEEQAILDKERVVFREKQLLQKLIEKDDKMRAREQAEVEKDERLENLRKQVRPIAVVKPERVWQDTESWHNRVAGDEDAQEVDIQRPLFKVNSYTAAKVNEDSRVRLENKLRDMGLHNTDYGRQMIKQMKPPTQPRKDMESTVFKFNTNES